MQLLFYVSFQSRFHFQLSSIAMAAQFSSLSSETAEKKVKQSGLPCVVARC